MAISKRALLIGVNLYKIAGADLRGCVNDVRNIEPALKKYYGFKAANISVLTDYDATKSKIEKGIRDLIRGSKAGDVLYLHYSGHGSNVEDTSGDEPDRRDEIMCPTDLNWKKPLTDDWLRTQFDKVKPGVNLTVVMDCCHSGTITRQIQPPDAKVINRFLPSPFDIAEMETAGKIRGKILHPRGLKPARKSRGSVDVEVVDIPEVLITGCKSDQTSADAFIEGSYNGALTYYLVKAIAENDGKLSYRDLHEQTLCAIKKEEYDQTPQLEGGRENLERNFLESFATS